jgi:hypothetical protein
MHQCVVVAPNGAIRESMALILKSWGVDSILLESLGELHDTLSTIPVCGILIEISASITASAQHKKETLAFLDLYPAAKFRFIDGKIAILGQSLDEFIDSCLEFQPRVLRKTARNDKYFALYLSADKTFLNDEKTVTINVSTEGYFIYSVREWQIGDRVWLRFLDDAKILQGTVRSVRPWGNNRFLPGIGIKLDS